MHQDMKKTINVGVCGLGTVGAGTVQLLQNNMALIQQRTGVTIRVTRAATIDAYQHLDIDFKDLAVTDSVDDVLNDPDIDVIVELIGGDGLAKKIILEAFDKGKSVVTANKALIAKHSQEIFRSAFESSGMFGFEASVGGGIPIIRSIRDGFSGDRIESISGIMNGTANYILSSMSNDGTEFNDALKMAQEKGYAEADPTFDIEGIDTAHKVVILMELAFNAFFDFDQLYTEGITKIEPADIQLARQFGYAIKLIGQAHNSEKGIEGRVHPALVSLNNMLASVQGAFNAISVTGNFVGNTLSYGAGAGSHPTASAVAGDIIEISRRLTNLGGEATPPLSASFDRLEKVDLIPMEETESRFFLRFNTKNPDEGLAIVGEELNRKDIKIGEQQILEPGLNGEKSVAILIPAVSESKMQTALNHLNGLDALSGSIGYIRIFE